MNNQTESTNIFSQFSLPPSSFTSQSKNEIKKAMKDGDTTAQVTILRDLVFASYSQGHDTVIEYLHQKEWSNLAAKLLITKGSKETQITFITHLVEANDRNFLKIFTKAMDKYWYEAAMTLLLKNELQAPKIQIMRVTHGFAITTALNRYTTILLSFLEHREIMQRITSQVQEIPAATEKLLSCNLEDELDVQESSLAIEKIALSLLSFADRLWEHQSTAKLLSEQKTHLLSSINIILAGENFNGEHLDTSD